MKTVIRLPKWSIGGLIAQIAILAYLFFAINSECRYIEISPWKLYERYVSDWKLRNNGGIVNLLWFLNIPLAMNALGSIRYLKSNLENNNIEKSLFFILFYLYNTLFCLGTLLYCLWITSRIIVFQGLHGFVGGVLLILATPMFFALLAFAIRQILRREFTISLLSVSTTLIVMMELGYLTSIIMYPPYI